MHVSDLTVYPIKSVTGLTGTSFQVEKEGLSFDRHWVVVDESGIAITGRDNAELLTFSTEIKSDHLVVWHISGDRREIPFDAFLDKNVDVAIFSSTGYGREVSVELSAWFSEKLRQPCRLVVSDPAKQRGVQEKYGGSTGDVVKFADMNPILLLSEASVDDLNSKLETPVSVRNFRPNIVVVKTQPFEEDTWKRIQIGECIFKVVQQCERCVFTTIDPDTRQKNKQGEPLRTLVTYRRTESGGVAFGMHLIPERIGTIRVGDEVQVMN